jgi:hypothetical protein
MHLFDRARGAAERASHMAIAIIQAADSLAVFRSPMECSAEILSPTGPGMEFPPLPDRLVAQWALSGRLT